MDIRQLALASAPIREVDSVGISEYHLGPDRVAALESLLPEFVNAEYYDPVFQAWSHLLFRYLGSGVNPSLAKQYYGCLVDKTPNLGPPQCEVSPLFGEILCLKNSNSSQVFENVDYVEIENFCNEYCRFYIARQDVVRSQLYKSSVYDETLEEMLNINSWEAVMSSLVLYRHCQIEDYVWPKELHRRLAERVADWLQRYSDAFARVMNFVAGEGKGYPWYCKDVIAVIRRTWETALVIKGRPAFITANDVYSLPVNVAQELVTEVNGCPAVYDDPLKEDTVFNAFNAIFFATDEDNPRFALDTYTALCVPKTFFKRMCNILYEFYWLVQDDLLTSRLYTRRQVEYESGSASLSHPDSYLRELYSRGFPKLK